VLDEPTANLDPAGAAALMDRVAQLRDSRRTTIVLIEHDVDRAWPMADMVLALGADGVPIDAGPPADVLARSAPTLRTTGIWLPGDRIRRRPAPGGPQPEEGPRDVVVTTDDVGFGFERDRAVLVDASLSIGAGERVALVGPNGSGKSTLGRLLVGLLRPSAGSIRLRGEDPARMPAATLARRAGYAFQDPERQFLAATVADEARLGLRPDERARADILLASLGLPLERFADRSPYQLSGGEQRRLSLACILVRRPDLLVLDEPTFGQDRHGHEALLEILHDRVAKGTAVLAATHDRRFVESFATRVLEMRGGSPVEIPT
jgi:energy-coupling factor transport system ATP-binding protein